MFHSKIEPRASQPADIHPRWCGCADCHQGTDPLGYARARRTVRLQAAFLLTFVAIIYGLILANLGGIAASFGFGS